MDEETVYEQLSSEFGDLVSKMKSYRTILKKSEGYEKIDIKSEEANASGIEVKQLDYYYFFKIYCLGFSREVFPNGIQQLWIYTRNNSEDLEFNIVPPGGFFAGARKRNRFRFNRGKETYSVEHSLDYSLNLPQQPCLEEAAWKEDECKLDIVSRHVMDSFNCTTPWLLHHAR